MKAYLASGVTDPASASRPNDSAFVMSTWPEQKSFYPHIIVAARFGATQRLGAQSEIMNVPVRQTIQVIAEKMSDRDQLAGSIFNLLRVVQHDINSIANTGSGTTLERMYDFQLLNSYSIDEPGKKGLHRHILECQYDVVAG